MPFGRYRQMMIDILIGGELLRNRFRQRLQIPNIAPKTELNAMNGGFGNGGFVGAYDLRRKKLCSPYGGYIHHNPVKHGLVRTVGEWPYSSFHRMVKMGIYPSNWAGLDLELFEAGKRGS